MYEGYDSKTAETANDEYRPDYPQPVVKPMYEFGSKSMAPLDEEKIPKDIESAFRGASIWTWRRGAVGSALT